MATSQSQNLRVQDQIALVTGANRGIGFEVCRLLSRKGVRVLLSARDNEKGSLAATQLIEEGFADVMFVQLDVTDAASVRAAAGTIEREFGRLDILVNNAGILPDNHVPGQFAYASILTTDIADVQKAWDTNALGALRVCQAMLPLMRKFQYGRIVNVSSLAAQLTSMTMGMAAYRLSKVQLNALTRLIADEFKSENILCNAISPGWVKTDMGGPVANVSVEDAALAVVRLALLPDDGPTGAFIREGKLIEW